MPVLFQNFSFNGINMKNMQLDDWKSELGIACFTFFPFSRRFFFVCSVKGMSFSCSVSDVN